MKRFVSDTLLPLLTVVATIAILTLAVFDPPPEGPPAPPAPAVEAPPPAEPALSAHTPNGTSSAQALVPRGRGADIVGKPAARRRAMNAVVARAIRALTEPPASERQPSPGQSADLAVAIQRLGEAVQTARNAKTEKDFARAEEMLRSARAQMERSCGEPTSPLCQSARAMKDLGD